MKCCIMMTRIQRTCQNPWNGACDNVDITVYIHYEGEQRPICRSCWRKIAHNGVE